MSVTPIRPDLAPSPVSTQLTESMAQTLKTFEAEGVNGPPTGAVWVVFDNAGGYRVGWDTNNCALPSTAVVGMAMAALMSSHCHHD